MSGRNFARPSKPFPHQIVLKRILSNIKIPSSPPPSDFCSDILNHMKKNANPRQCLKLIKMNKFFIPKKCPFLRIQGERLVLDESKIKFLIRKKNYKVEKLSNNLFFYGQLRVEHEALLPELIAKLVVSEIHHLYFSAFRISFDDFKFLACKELRGLELNETIVTSENGEIVPFEILIDELHSLHELKVYHKPSSPLSNNFVDKICASKMEKFDLSGLHENFDFEELLISLKKKPNLQIRLNFDNPIANLERVTTYAKKCFAAGIHDSVPPTFNFILDRQTEANLIKFRQACSVLISLKTNTPQPLF